MKDKCERCESAEDLPLHTCPYAVDIHDDYESKCNCCEACQYQCAMSV